MKFTKGLIIGGLITTGILMIYSENQDMERSKKRMMKKGKQLIKKMGIV